MFQQIQRLVVEGDTEGSVQLTREALDAGTSPHKILDEGLIVGLTEVGKGMEAATYFIPEALAAGRAVKAAVEVLKPMLLSTNVEPSGRVILATVEGDVHDIGKNLVKLMLECAGFTVIDLGVNVPAAKILEATREHQPHILGLSALLSTTVLQMKGVIELLRQSGVRDNVKIMVGGAVVTLDYAEKIGADAYSPNCFDAVRRAQEMVQD